MVIGKTAHKQKLRAKPVVGNVKELQTGDVIRILEDWEAPRSRVHYYGSPTPMKAGTIGIVLFQSETIYFSDRQIASTSPLKFEVLEPPYMDYKPGDQYPINPISTGTDPEVFVVDANGVVIPAWKFLGTKKQATGHKLLEGSYNNRAFYDGFQGEFTTKAGGCHDGQISAIRHGLREILVAAQKFDPKATLTHKCVLEVPYEMMQSASDDHAALGCEPSLNVYDEEPLSIPYPKQLAIRFAGCHMHWGRQLGQHAIKRAVKAMDAIAGVAMVSLLDGLEDERRRQFYGRAGEYRLPAHGIEWRVPSSAVLVHPVVTYLCFDFARMAYSNGIILKAQNWKTSETEVREIVNSCDVKAARKVLVRNRIMLQKLLDGHYGEIVGNFACQLILKGAKELLPTENMIANWLIQSAASPDFSLRICEWHNRSKAEAQVVALEMGAKGAIS